MLDLLQDATQVSMQLLDKMPFTYACIHRRHFEQMCVSCEAGGSVSVAFRFLFDQKNCANELRL